MSRKLVAYFSASGVTAAIVQMLDALGYDIELHYVKKEGV